jgi:hypothetical protein
LCPRPTIQYTARSANVSVQITYALQITYAFPELGGRDRAELSWADVGARTDRVAGGSSSSNPCTPV